MVVAASLKTGFIYMAKPRLPSIPPYLEEAFPKRAHSAVAQFHSLFYPRHFSPHDHARVAAEEHFHTLHT